MKRLLTGALALILSIAASATTLNPIQLLNPAGSTSGQVIVSTGASSVPAWGGVGVNGIAAIAANTVLANSTGSSASPTAFAMPGCSTSSSALNWTTSTGFTCNTAINAATLGGATFASPGSIGGTTAAAGKFTTLQATSTITPSTTAGIVGTTLGDSANAGSIGEILTGTTSGSSISSGVTSSVASVSLSAGDWDVQCSAQFTPSSTVSGYGVGVSSSAGSLGGLGVSINVGTAFTSGFGATLASPIARVNISATQTEFCTVNTTFTGTMTANGFIRARRVR